MDLIRHNTKRPVKEYVVRYSSLEASFLHLDAAMSFIEHMSRFYKKFTLQIKELSC